jgi:membrane-associated protein
VRDGRYVAAKMNYTKFFAYNIIGGGVWVAGFMFLGYFFGAIPVVQENFAITVGLYVQDESS